VSGSALTGDLVADQRPSPSAINARLGSAPTCAICGTNHAPEGNWYRRRVDVAITGMEQRAVPAQAGWSSVGMGRVEGDGYRLAVVVPLNAQQVTQATNDLANGRPHKLSSGFDFAGAISVRLEVEKKPKA
jgi:hypothetical protein